MFCQYNKDLTDMEGLLLVTVIKLNTSFQEIPSVQTQKSVRQIMKFLR